MEEDTVVVEVGVATVDRPGEAVTGAVVAMAVVVEVMMTVVEVAIAVAAVGVDTVSRCHS